MLKGVALDIAFCKEKAGNAYVVLREMIRNDYNGRLVDVLDVTM
jgi:hypothetical protein